MKCSKLVHSAFTVNVENREAAMPLTHLVSISKCNIYIYHINVYGKNSGMNDLCVCKHSRNFYISTLKNTFGV
jgi:hypothetical protein